MNPFEKHGITHLSASSLNLWRESPGIWALQYLGKVKDDGNPSFWRGSAVETGLTAILRGDYLEEAIFKAVQSFEMNCQGETSDAIDADGELIAPMVHQCQLWKPPGELLASQVKMEYFFDSIPIPIPVIGYVDFSFPEVDYDLKTTKACPSQPRPAHVRQVALYRAARKKRGGLLYVTAKRHLAFEIDDDAMAAALEDLESDAYALYKFLGKVDSANDALACLPIDRSHFRFPKNIPSDLLAAG